MSEHGSIHLKAFDHAGVALLRADRGSNDAEADAKLMLAVLKNKYKAAAINEEFVVTSMPKGRYRILKWIGWL